MKNILITEAKFYTDIAEELALGTIERLNKGKFSFERIEVPGALEIPAAIKLASESGKFDGFIALGCVIRGETSHYDTVCNESARGIMSLTINHNLAIANGILTVENRDQAWARASRNDKNKGASFAEACIRMMEIKDKYYIK